MKVGVIGVGVVGKAIYDAIKPVAHVVGYDKYKEGYQAWEPILDCDIAFVSVPTPTLNGAQDLTALKQVAHKLEGFKGVVVNKCTVAPGTTSELIRTTGLHWVHSPEFLTAKTPHEDFMNQKVVILGGYLPKYGVLDRLFKKIVPHAKLFYYPNPTTTEMIKYMHNMYLTLKVSFCNEIYEVCHKLGVGYDEVRDAVVEVGQMDTKHTLVPGPDGQFGFGGMCFPKDAGAYVEFVKALGIEPDTIQAAIAGNKRRR